jgi:hypothetical protein
LIFSPNHRDLLPLAFANSPIAAYASLIFALESLSNGETNALSRIFSGDFHIPPKKSAFFQPFLRFLLAFRASPGL